MKRITSTKGEYGIGYEMSGSEIRDIQGLLANRNAQLSTMRAQNLNMTEHKMEFVKNIRGIDFINDAASVNANGIYMALSNLQKKAVWITAFEQWGEVGNQFAEMMEFIKTKITSVVFVGSETSPSRTIIEGMDIPTEHAADMESAVRTAFYSAGINQSVLFSPGATDIFGEGISQSGDSFKSAVAQL
ncbi:MAG: hypothetical protein IJP72_09915 [Bacteroidales bacterium]|nr:hypothetical protein [Bacteroidales bacterium]